MKHSRLVVLLALWMVAVSARVSAQPETTIIRDLEGWLVPVSLSGFSGETASALRFDLEVAGFEIVTSEKAQYTIRGSNSEKLVGGVYGLNGASVFSREYTGGSVRSRAHAFADDIVTRVTGRKGVARTRIVFKAETGRGVSEIYIADYDGYNPRPMTRDQTINRDPVWVPGQLKLYYVTYQSRVPVIYSHDLRTGTRKRIAAYSGISASPAVSPDGGRITMILSKGGSPDVYVANADGSGLRQITRTRAAESSPCWSPDGQTLCFTSQKDGSPRLFTVPAAGGTMTKLAAGYGIATEPSWSPDGKQIAFTRQVSGRFEICVVPAAGGREEVLTEGEDPCWAPNSRTIVYTRREGDRRVLSLLDVPTKRRFDVRRLSASCSQADWAE